MGKMTKNRYPQKKPWKICDILVEIAAKKLVLCGRTYKKEKMMELNELGLTEQQCSSLNKRKITSVEAMLRKQPNHYWDFTNTYALDIQDEQTCAILQRRAPFAIIGNLPVLPDGAARPHHDAETES